MEIRTADIVDLAARRAIVEPMKAEDEIVAFTLHVDGSLHLVTAGNTEIKSPPFGAGVDADKIDGHRIALIEAVANMQCMVDDGPIAFGVRYERNVGATHFHKKDN